MIPANTRCADRNGNLLVIVSVLAMMISVSVFSLSYMSRTDVSTSVSLVNELRANYIAEGIANQIEAQTNSKPWNKRFWFLAAQAAGAIPATGAAAAFDRNTPQINLSGDNLPASEYEFAGVVKDLPSTLREYRIFVEIVYRDEKYAYSWDKRYGPSLLAGLNHDTTQLDKSVDVEGTGGTPTDSLIDQIKDQAEAAPPPGISSTGLENTLEGLHGDEEAFDATTITPAPATTPTAPGIPDGMTSEEYDAQFPDGNTAHGNDKKK